MEPVSRLLQLQDIRPMAFTAAEDLSASQYYLVALDANLSAVVHDPGVAALGMIGILQNAPAIGEPALIRDRGFSRIVTASSVSRGDILGPAGGGDKGKVAALNPTTDWHHHDVAGNPPDLSSVKVFVGIALEDADAGAAVLARLWFGWR